MMTLTQTIRPEVSRWNRQTYQRLKLALSLGLRHQIFVAVCDDLSLRNRLATELQTELDSPRLVNLNLKISDPNFLAQIAHWEELHRGGGHATLGLPWGVAPTFQILGIELLTRQPPSVQRLFLRHLQATPRRLPRLEYSLLLWLPQPWFYTIQQSAPEFWRWHTGIFEFEGEPTPVPLVSPESVSEAARSAVWSIESRIGNQNSYSSSYTDVLSQNATNSKQIETLDHDLAGLTSGVNTSLSALQLENEWYSEPSDSSTDLNAYMPNALATPVEQDEQSAFTELDFAASPLEAYLTLGNYYRDRIEEGDASIENLSIAIQAYEQALQNWPMMEEALQAVSPHPQADVLNDLGNLYWMLSRTPEEQPQEVDPAETQPQKTLSYLGQAIQAYQTALTTIIADDAPYTYAMIQNNLGAAYGDLARFSDPNIHHEQSIQAYQEALRYRPADIEPLKYASTQNNLGTAYWHLAQYQEPIKNLNLAIAAYTAALSYYNSDQDPLNWAMIQNNLGTAYWNLAQYEQPTIFLHKAIDAYQNALLYRIPELVPAACAATQNNLGTAYWHLSNLVETLPATSCRPKGQMEYLKMSIEAYETAIALALELVNRDSPALINFDVFATCNNLGLAYYQLATEPQFGLAKEDKSAHLETALERHLLALEGFTYQPDNYQSALAHIIKTIRALYRECGLQGQNLALSKVPGHLLPEILPRL